MLESAEAGVVKNQLRQYKPKIKGLTAAVKWPSTAPVIIEPFGYVCTRKHTR
jgi:hypothetical protein